jgi:catechol 2,3-dioxygenase-like lactoylglutathione lyase family enzyme
MNTSAGVTRLRGLALGAPGLTASEPFYTECWGLETVHSEPGAVYLRGSGPEHHILALHDRAARGIVQIDFAVPDETRLHEFHDRLVADGTAIAQPLGPNDAPGGGTSFALVDPDHRLLRISAGVERYPDAPDRPAAPRKITHVVLNTPQLETSLAFYERVLGFRVSDWSEDQMVFIRCNSDHHSIAFNRARHASLNHIAFEMPSLDDEMRGIGRLKSHEVPVAWGVGRHGPGNNVFAYFRDPNDFVIEYTTEIAQIDEATHEPQVWKRVPHLMDRWGTAGPPSPEIRKSMAGQPDPGYQG